MNATYGVKSMRRRRQVIIQFLWIVAASISFMSCAGPQRMGEIVQTWESSEKPFKVKIDMHIERGGFMPAATAGAYYVFYSNSARSSDWREVMTFRHDDPIPIPDNQVRYVTDEVAYFFIGPFFAITQDSGESWRTLNAYKNIQNIQCCYYGVIDDIQLQPDGTGMLRLDPKAVSGITELKTQDFGLHWEP